MKHIKKITFLILATLIFAVLKTPRVAFAAILSVPSQYSSIQAAINAASNGDVVAISPGTYRENISIVGKYIEVRSANGDPNTTILAPNSGQTGIMIQQVPYQSGLPRVKINGLKITGGYSPDGQGGAITAAFNADPIIINNNLDHNRSTVDGGAVLIYNNSHPTILNNTITYNSAQRFGGGVFVVKNSSPVIYNNTISNNSVTGAVIPSGGSSGGAIYLEADSSNASLRSSPVVMNNTITNNSADFAGGGIMLRVGVDAIIEENTISNNQSAYGGGVHAETQGSNPVIYNNTIQNNKAIVNGSFAGSGYGGGISVYASSQARILKNQLMGNTASKGGAGIVLAESSNSTVSNNLISGNSVDISQTTTNNSGGGIYIANAQANVTNNVFLNNSANLGGGVAIFDNAVILLINNTLVKNNANFSGAPAAGGGVFVRNQAGVNASLTNNILALNQNVQVFEESKKASFTNNLIANDNSGIYFNYNTGTVTTMTGSSFNGNPSITANGNITGAPGFIDATTDKYDLTAASIAKDAGIATGAPTEDYKKAVRPFGASFDIGAYEYTTETAFKSPVYRFWSNESKSHFYTSSNAEKAMVVSSYPIQTWHYEFQAYDTFGSSVANSTAIYRFYSPQFNGHFYTADVAEKDYIIANYPTSTWTYENIAFYAYPISFSGNTNTVYRFFSPVSHHHFFTASIAERDSLISNSTSASWQYENARYKVPQ